MSNRSNSSRLSVITTTVLIGATGLTVAAVVALASLTFVSRTAEATPQYSQQTKLPCGQCHQNPAGSGPLKPFGQRYKDKGHKL